MSENQVKDRIVEEVKIAKETGKITSKKINEIVRKAVADAVSEGKGGAEAIRPIVKDAMSAAVEGLRAAEADAAENIKAVLEGAVAGVRVHKDQAVDVVRKEMREVEEKLAAEKIKLAQSVRDALQGAKEAGALLPEEIGTRIESLSADIKLKSTELFGLTEQTVKEAVKQAIESSENVKETVAQIARDATERALKERRFTADRVKKIAEKVMSGAVEAAEEAGKEVKDVAHGAFEGAQKGIASAVESIGDKTREFIHDDLARTKEDLETIEELFLETAGRVAKRSGETAKAVLVDLVERTERTTSVLREKTGHATEKVAERLKKAGLAVIYERKWRLLYDGNFGKLGFDVIPHLGAALGNVYTYANAGMEARLGWNIPRDFGTSLIRPSGASNAPLNAQDPRISSDQGFGLYVFATADGRAVLHNIFLDGNTFTDSHSVDKKHFVADIGTGVGLIIHRFKLCYTHVLRTKEFTGQEDNQVFGSITFSWTY